MFQTEELPELILRGGDEEHKAEPQGPAVEGERAVAALAGPSSAELAALALRQLPSRLSCSSPANPE